MTESKKASNTAQAKQVDKEKLKAEQYKADVQFLLGTAQGRRFVWEMLSYCQIYGHCFTGNSETYYREGKRSVGLKLMSDVLAASPDAYIQMMQEHKGEINV